MADLNKVINGLKRCLICDTSVIASAEGQKAYIDCEYTVGLYCDRNRLLRDALELLKSKEEKQLESKQRRLEYCKQYRESHKEHARQTLNEWRKKNPEKVKAQKARARERQRLKKEGSLNG